MSISGPLPRSLSFHLLSRVLKTPPEQLERVYVGVALDLASPEARLERFRGALGSLRTLIEQGAAPMAPALIRALCLPAGAVMQGEEALVEGFQRALFLTPGGRGAGMEPSLRPALERARALGLPVEFATLPRLPKGWSPSFLTPGGIWMRPRSEAPPEEPTEEESPERGWRGCYLGTPLGGETQEVILEHYRAALWSVATLQREGRVAVAPHLVYSLVLEERCQEERQLGIHLDLALMTGMREVVLATPDGTPGTLSLGMRADLERARQLDLSVEFRLRPPAPPEWADSALLPEGRWLQSAAARVRTRAEKRSVLRRR